MFGGILVKLMVYGVSHFSPYLFLIPRKSPSIGLMNEVQVPMMRKKWIHAIFMDKYNIEGTDKCVDTGIYA